jgi:Ca2+/Na+ antiporter
MAFSIQDHFPVYSVLLLILISISGYILDFIPCQIKHALNSNIYVKHLIGFMTLVFFVVLSIPVKFKRIYEILKTSTILYLFFILLLKTEIWFFMTVLVILSIIYVLVIRKTEIDDNITEMKKKIGHDEINHNPPPLQTPSTTSTEFTRFRCEASEAVTIVSGNLQTDLSGNAVRIQNEIAANQTEYDNIVKINNGLFIMLVPIMCLGFVIYLGKKKIQYKNNFDIKKFIIGTTKCKSISTEQRTEHIPIMKAIQNAFK